MSNVNYIKHLNGWYAKVQEDKRLNTTHLALYMALFQMWNINRFRNPLSVARQELMRLSKIGSANTYTKCMKDLHQWGYIDYHPSYNALKGSMVNMYNFGTTENKPAPKQPNQPTKHVNQNKNYGEPL